MRYITIIITLFITGCTHHVINNEKFLNNMSDKKFSYENRYQFSFKIPSNGRDLIPSFAYLGTEITDADILKTKRKLAWIVNTTYLPIARLTYSGKYSIRVALVALDENIMGSISTTENFAKYMNKKDLIKYKTKSNYVGRQFSNQSWIFERSVSTEKAQSIISAAILINEKRYIFFVFEYLGNDENELELLEQVSNATLNTFKLISHK